MLNRIFHPRPSPSPGLQANQQGDLKLSPGEIIKGTVVKKYPPNEVLVSYRGQQFRANTTLGLKEGKTYHFQVKNMGSQTELKVLDGTITRSGAHVPSDSFKTVTGAKLTNLIKTLSRADNIRGLSDTTIQAIKSLRQFIPSILYKDLGDNNGLWLHRLILGSGLFWENKVLRSLMGEKNKTWNRLITSDLKGLLLSLESSLRSEDPNHHGLKPMTDKIKQAISLIEQDQLQNLSGIREDTGWFFFIPGFGDDGFRKGELFVRNSDEREGLNFSIFLDFTHLGQVEFDVSIIESIIGIRIHAEDTEKANYLTANIHLLEKGLRDLGITTGTILCDVKEDPCAEEEQSESMHLII